MELTQLVIKARSGDHVAFGRIVRRFQDMAFGCAYAWLGDTEDAQDAAQDAFIEAWQDLDKLRDPAAFPGWFRRIVRKRADRHFRARKPAITGDFLERLPSALPDPLAHYETQEVKNTVHRAIAALPQSQRLPLTLFHLEGYRQRHIAAFLELPLATVKKRIFDARQSLQRKMLNMVEETLDQARPSRDDSFARKVEFFVAFNAADLAAMERLLDQDPALIEATADWQVAPGLRAAGWEATAAAWAAHMGHRPMLEMLLDRGANLDNPGHRTEPLLHIAVSEGQSEIAKLLIERGAKPNATASCRHTPLHRAVIRGEDEIAALLVEAGADLEVGDYRGRTAADWAAMKGRSRLAAWLVEQGARAPQPPMRQPKLKKEIPKPSRQVPSAEAVLGRYLDPLGAPIDGAQPLGAAVEDLHASAEEDARPILETGLKAIDLFAPFPRGGHVGIDSAMGVGNSLLVEQLARNIIESYDARVVYLGVGHGDPQMQFREWRGFVADGKLLAANSLHVLAPEGDEAAYLQAAETALSLAESFRSKGHDVLLYVQSPVALTAGVLPYLRTQIPFSPKAAITTCYLGDMPHGVEDRAFAFLDATIHFDINRARAALFPAIDLFRSRSRLLKEGTLGEAHCRLVARARGCFTNYYGHNMDAVFEDGRVRREALSHISAKDQDATEQLMIRSRRLDRFLTQPYHGTELWVGEPGETVALEDTLEGTRQILDGRHDDVAEEAFSNVGTIAQALEKAKRI